MQRTIASTTGAFLIAAIAIAAADIPARYVGSFPSFARFTNMTGTFTGSKLLLNGTLIAGTRFTPVTGEFTCTPASPTQTRCPGRFRGEGKGGGAPGVLTVTWKAGVPVEVTFVK